MTSALLPWLSAPDRPAFGPVDVHVWRVNLDGPSGGVERLARFLAQEELERASRFAAPADRRRYITRRAALRILLGRYLDIGPAELRFRSDSRGKPRLEREAEPGGLRFNVSHSEGLALYAVSRGRETGVDVERIRPHLASRWIAERFFSPREADRLSQLSEDAYADGFFACWTRTEAYLKACGRGLGGVTDGEADDRSGWALRDLAPGPRYAGALAVEGHDHRLVCWELACSS